MAALKALASPGVIAAIVLLGGSAFAVFGVFLLAGLGWAMLTAAAPFLLVAGVLIRGLARDE